jgi:hypothetical protein
MDLETLKTLTFRFAKTMPEIPHEYVVRTPDNAAAFNELSHAIKDLGVMERFGRRFYRYWYPGNGWKYWAMTTRDDVEIINRAKVEDDSGPEVTF